MGQAEDLMRTVAEDLTHNFFFTMALSLFTITGWCLLGLVLRPLKEIPDTVRIALVSLLAIVSPLIVDLAYSAPGTIGALWAQLSGILLPAGGMAFLMLPYQRKGISVERVITVMAYTWVVITFLVVAVVVVSPDFWGLFLGPVTVLLLLIVVAIWTIWFLAVRSPALSVLLLLALVLAASQGQFGVRAARTIAGRLPRPSSSEYARHWLQSKTGRRPVFITSDGGGIRAAYWTAIVLGALAHDAPGFVSQIYAASGVSGGSVGLAVFAAFPNKDKAKQALSFDFLAAPLTRLLVRDPVDSVACLGWRWRAACSGSDRQIAAETVFEGACPRLTQSLEAPLPFLLALNMTNADTGERLVASNVRLDEKVDVLSKLPANQTLRLSTAMLLSARFPVISPAGELPLNGKPVRIVDGGYADNSGGATGSEILGDLLQAADGAAIKPLGIMITNDPVRSHGQFCEAPADAPAGSDSSILSLVSTPVGTLDAGRQHAAETHRAEFRHAIENAGGDVREVPLFRCKADDDPEFPLGWSLSETVRSHMDGKLSRLREVERGPYRELVRFLQ